MRSMRYGRSLTSSRNSTQPSGGSKAYGVPSDATSCVDRAAEQRTLRPRPARSTSSPRARARGRRRRPISAQKRALVVAGGAARQTAFEHRAVQRVMPQPQCQPREQRRVVAVADEQLRRARRAPARSQERQHLHAAVAAAHGNQRRRPTDRSSARMNARRARIRRSRRGSPTRWRRRTRRTPGRTRAGATPPTPRSNSSRANGLAGATIGDPIAWLQRPRACTHHSEPGHLVRDALVLVAAEHVAKRGAPVRSPPAPPGTAPSRARWRFSASSRRL